MMEVIDGIESKPLFERLAMVQLVLKAPKSQYNSFGKYRYRSAEDIMEAAKPVCFAHGLVLTVSDTVECIGGRNYVCATATVRTFEGGAGHSVMSYAREAESKKGMDDSQVTGTASSYARKYALGGLFCLDDTKDADAAEGSESRYKPPVGKEGGKEPRRGKAPSQEPREQDALEAAIAKAKNAIKAASERNGLDPAAEWKAIQTRRDADTSSAAWWEAIAREYGELP